MKNEKLNEIVIEYVREKKNCSFADICNELVVTQKDLLDVVNALRATNSLTFNEDDPNVGYGVGPVKSDDKKCAKGKK